MWASYVVCRILYVVYLEDVLGGRFIYSIKYIEVVSELYCTAVRLSNRTEQNRTEPSATTRRASLRIAAPDLTDNDEHHFSGSLHTRHPFSAARDTARYTTHSALLTLIRSCTLMFCLYRARSLATNTW
ncbi:GSCOCG00005636001-RA-CDS, partial [Cotesia congregata]